MKTIIAVIFLVFAIIIGLTAIDTGKAYLDKELGLTSTQTSTSSQVLSSEEQNLITITLSGEIESPGTYEIESGMFLEEAISLAGGITSKADTDCFDFYFTLEENITIYIPPISEETKVSINYASLDELMTLTGIGKTLGDRIIEYRDQIKTFDYLEELMKVEGIGKSIFNRIRDKICL